MDKAQKKLETELMEELYGAYRDKYVHRMEVLKKEKDFIRDDSVHGKPSPIHIMYKLKLDKDGSTNLVSSDGKRGYEFLVEFDKEDAGYGIYYGCRGLVLGGDQREEIDNFISEWENLLKGEVCKVLNDTFTEMDFSGRFQATNNANDMTFWPFWIALGEDEDVVEVAARATKLIANIYKMYLNNGSIIQRKVVTKKIETVTEFTEKAYNNTISQLRKYNNNPEKLFKKFIRKAIAYGYLEINPKYEKCWQFKQLKNVDVAFLIKYLCERMGIIENNKTPWFLFIPLFLSKSGENMKSIKQSLSGPFTPKENENMKNLLERWNIK